MRKTSPMVGSGARAADPRRRPGGRSARISSQVHAAVLELLDEHDWAALTIPVIAERSGVHQATVYRRWGDVAALVDEVAGHELARSAPIPDTGTLRGDLDRYAVQVAANVAGPLGRVFLRAAVLAGGPGHEVNLPTRAEHLQGMLDRAAARGEAVPTLQELFELVMAPLYFHALFFDRPADATHAKQLVRRLLTLVKPGVGRTPPAGD
jgi:AcrR family transcriptional regulator